MPRADYFTARGTTVLYLPLDNRPVNDLRVEALADSTGMNVLLPPEDLYATRLDGRRRMPTARSTATRTPCCSGCWTMRTPAMC